MPSSPSSARASTRSALRSSIPARLPADANDYIVYDRATGLLTYDANGNAAGGAIAFASLANHPVLTSSDFLVI